MECVHRTQLSRSSDFSSPLDRSQGAAGPHRGDKKGRLLEGRPNKCISDVKQTKLNKNKAKTEALSLGTLRFSISGSNRRGRGYFCFLSQLANIVLTVFKTKYTTEKRHE